MGKLFVFVVVVAVVVFGLIATGQACRDPTGSSEYFDHTVITKALRISGKKTLQITTKNVAKALAPLQISATTTDESLTVDAARTALVEHAKSGNSKYLPFYTLLMSRKSYVVPKNIPSGHVAYDTLMNIVETLSAVFALDAVWMKPLQRFIHEYWEETYNKFIMNGVAKVEILIEFRTHSERFIALDKFFKGALGIGEEVSEQDYFDKLKAFNLAESELNVDAMIKAISKPSLVSFWKQPKLSSEQQLEEFLSVNCHEAFEDYKERMNRAVLSQIFNAKQFCDAKILIITEYHRICLAWFDERKKEQMLMNIYERIAQSQQIPIN